MNTIKVKSYSKVMEEFVAAEAITPGMLVEVKSDGEIQKHSTEDGDAIPMFAFEDELQGKGINDAYAEDAPAQVWIPYRGDQVYAILAQGENVTRGTFLSSNGDGRLKAAAEPSSLGGANPLQVVAMALEPINATSAAKRITVVII